MGLPLELDRPLIGIVSRFVDQKGFDLVGEITQPLLLEQNVALVVLGSGEPRFEDMFRYFACARPDRFGVSIGYDNALAHRIEAGADMFLMPSRYEPSGLNQMYSLRYGTVPIVRATGGLDDTVDDADRVQISRVLARRAGRGDPERALRLSGSRGLARPDAARHGRRFLLGRFGGEYQDFTVASVVASKGHFKHHK